MMVVVFDIDGTLFDTKNGIIAALNDVYNFFGMPNIPKYDEDKYIGPSIRDSFKRYGHMNDELAEIATVQYRKKYVEKYIQESELYIGAKEVLSFLRDRGDHVCIATMKTKPQVDKLLCHNDLNEYFEVVMTAREDGSLLKSDMLFAIKDKWSTIKSDIDFIMVGDTAGDQEAAERSGYDFVYAKYGYGDLARKDCLLEIDSLKEFTRYLKKYKKSGACDNRLK